MSNVTFEIREHIATISTSAKGWTKELNLISWNGAEPKLDIRDWAPEHEKMGKGITLSTEEGEELMGRLAVWYGYEPYDAAMFGDEEPTEDESPVTEPVVTETEPVTKTEIPVVHVEAEVVEEEEIPADIAQLPIPDEMKRELAKARKAMGN